MAESQEEASLRLYQILERVGLSEEMRLCHRQAETIHTVCQTLRNGLTTKMYNFGSFSEGSTILDMKSDIDFVYFYETVPVVTNAGEAKDRTSLLMVHDDHTYAGYVKLQEVKNGIPMTMSEMTDDKDFGPDTYGRKCFRHVMLLGGTPHGPAEDFRDNDDQSYDTVFALKCVSVPDSVKQWLLRPRQYGWPSQRCLDHMSHLPYLVVGVGHQYSVDRDLEWRLSYSFHERELMFSLNPTQHKCYGTMKMIKRDVIEPAVGEESISSYHLKTCLFWAIEKTPADIWQPDQLLYCLKRCFWYLLYFVLTQNCPNYFRPDANLFEREVFKRLQDRLFCEINRIIQSLHDVVSQIRCAHVGRIFSNNCNIPIEVLKSKHVQRMVLSDCVIGGLALLSKELVHVCSQNNSQPKRFAKLYHLLYTLSRTGRIPERTEEQTDEARTLMLPFIHFRLATCLAAEGFNVNNGPICQYLLQLSILHLTQSTTRDLMGARLMYVTILYKLGRYRQCETLLRHIDRDLQPQVMTYCNCKQKENLLLSNAFNDWVRENKQSIRSMLISAIVTCVTLIPSERDFVPEPLQYELNRSRDNPDIPSTDEDGRNIFDWACVDGKVYFHLMDYLVSSQLNNSVLKQAARDKIVRVIANDPNLRHIDTAYNVLGWIYMKEQAYMDACRCWRRSLKVQPSHNAATRHLQVLKTEWSDV